jgi:hypothetical protein
MGENICKQCDRQGLVSKLSEQLTQLDKNANNPHALLALFIHRLLLRLGNSAYFG